MPYQHLSDIPHQYPSHTGPINPFNISLSHAFTFPLTRLHISSHILSHTPPHSLSHPLTHVSTFPRAFPRNTHASTFPLTSSHTPPPSLSHLFSQHSVQLSEDIQRANVGSNVGMHVPMHTRSMQNNHNDAMMMNEKAALFGQALGVFEGGGGYSGGGYNGGGGGYSGGGGGFNMAPPERQQVVRRERNQQKQPPTTRVIKLQEVCYIYHIIQSLDVMPNVSCVYVYPHVVLSSRERYAPLTSHLSLLTPCPSSTLIPTPTQTPAAAPTHLLYIIPTYLSKIHDHLFLMFTINCDHRFRLLLVEIINKVAVDGLWLWVVGVKLGT